MEFKKLAFRLYSTDNKNGKGYPDNIKDFIETSGTMFCATKYHDYFYNSKEYEKHIVAIVNKEDEKEEVLAIIEYVKHNDRIVIIDCMFGDEEYLYSVVATVLKETFINVVNTDNITIIGTEVAWFSGYSKFLYGIYDDSFPIENEYDDENDQEIIIVGKPPFKTYYEIIEEELEGYSKANSLNISINDIECIHFLLDRIYDITNAKKVPSKYAMPMHIAKKYLNYRMNISFPYITVWTKEYVIIINTYFGSGGVCVDAHKRNPPLSE